MDIEQWKPIPGYEGSYAASSHGRVRSLDRITDRGRKWRGRLLTPTPMKNGYLLVTLWRNGRQRTQLVHRLILAAFHGPCPDGGEALHRDGKRANNRLENLCWGTHSENQFDQVSHGTHHNASKTHCVRGHLFTPDNTYIYPGRNKRACRRCRSEYASRFNSRLEESA